MEAGARGCLAGDAEIDEVLRAVEAVRNGELWLSRKLFAQVLAHLQSQVVVPRVEECAWRLTDRQRQVAACVAEGMSNKQIGRRLGISPTTVKTHLHNIFERVGRRRPNPAGAARDGRRRSLTVALLPRVSASRRAAARRAPAGNGRAVRSGASASASARPPIQTASASVLTSSGSPSHSTRSASRPGSIRPTRVADAERLRRHARDRRERALPGQAVGDRVAGGLADLARVVGGVRRQQRDAHAGGASSAALSRREPSWSKLDGRFCSASTNTVALAAFSCAGHLPGLGGAGDHRAQAVAAGEGQQLADVGGALDVEHDASAGEVARQRLAPGRRQQRVRRIVGRQAARLAERLVEQHVLRRARAAAQCRRRPRRGSRTAGARRSSPPTDRRPGAPRRPGRRPGCRSPLLALSAVKVMPPSRATGSSIESGL